MQTAAAISTRLQGPNITVDEILEYYGNEASAVSGLRVRRST